MYVVEIIIQLGHHQEDIDVYKRQTKDDVIDHSVGIVLNKKIGDKCSCNDVLAYLYVNKEIEETLIDEVYNAYQIV